MALGLGEERGEMHNWELDPEKELHNLDSGLLGVPEERHNSELGLVLALRS